VSLLPFPSLIGDGGRFVGREAERQALASAAKRAAEGERQIVMVGGPPGVGKSRLAGEVARRAHDDGAIVLAGRCDEGLRAPYQPFVDALNHFVRHCPRHFLVDGLGHRPEELARLAPALREGMPLLAPPVSSDPDTERHLLFDAVASWLASCSAGEPVVLVLDDLHWADGPTLLLFRHVARALVAEPVLILGTFRDVEADRSPAFDDALAALWREVGVERMSLAGLEEPAVAAWMEWEAGHELDDPSATLASAIHAQTGGNPFFVREVLLHLAETGVIHERDGRWTCDPMADVGIPEGVREVVQQRLARLGGVTHDVLRRAAVIGLQFELTVLEAVAEVAVAALDDALEEARSAGLVQELPAAPITYRFAHALVRSTLLEGLGAGRRGRLHRRVGETIERLHAADVERHLADLAHHFAQATAVDGDADQAIHYAIGAGNHALSQLAHDQATEHFRRALDLLDSHASGRDDLRGEALIGLGEAQRRAGDPAHRQTLLDAARLAAAAGDARQLARAALANGRGTMSSASGEVDVERVAALEAALAGGDAVPDDLRARLLVRLALELQFAGDHDRCVDLGDEALGLARRCGDRATLAQVLMGHRNALGAALDPVTRAAESAELLTLARQLGDPAVLATALAFRASDAMEAGHVEESDRALAEFETLGAELDQPLLQWSALYSRSARVLFAGRLAESERLATEAMEVGQAAGQPDAFLFYGGQLFQIRLEQGRLVEMEPLVTAVAAQSAELVVARSLLALLYCELGRLDEARPVFDALAAEGFAAIPWDATRLGILAQCAMVCARLGDAEQAASLVERLEPVPVAVIGSDLSWLGARGYYLGLLATTLARWDDAERWFQEALTLHERLGAPGWCARTRLAWAELLLARSDGDDRVRAQALGREALATAERLGMEALAAQARAALIALA